MSALSGWQPIETAPSGEYVLLYLTRPSRSHVAWDIGANDGNGWYDQSAHELEPYDWRATHWQPLPPPPVKP